MCLFLPRRQFSSSVAPSFVEAVAGRPEATPDQKTIAHAEDLLVRLENDGVAVRLNLLGQPGEQPDFVVAGWVLPYVYALRGDRDWRRSPQLTGSRQVSQLAVQAYKQLEAGDATISQLKQALGREVSESAVIRAITELWQQLRIIPVIAARGQAAKWQLLRTRFQKAIAEGASTSQVTAISVLASIYLQAVIAASMEDVELFLAPLTARSKIREVHPRAGCDAPGAHHLAGPCAALLRRRNAARVRAGFDHVTPVRPCRLPLTFSAHLSGTRKRQVRQFRCRSRSGSLPFRSRCPLRFTLITGPAGESRYADTGSQAFDQWNLRFRAAAFQPSASNGRDHKPASASRPSKSGSNGRPARRSSDARPGPCPGRRAEPGRLPARAGAAAKNGKHNGAHASSHTTNGTRSNGPLRALQMATAHITMASRLAHRGASAPRAPRVSKRLQRRYRRARMCDRHARAVPR